MTIVQSNSLTLQNKVDFAIIFRVTNANPNGNPLDGNRPRIDYDGIGEITDVCLKRKLRDRLAEHGNAIFVQSEDRKTDQFNSLAERAKSVLNGSFKSPEATRVKACETWFDVRSFGQLFAIAGEKAKPRSGNGAKTDSAKDSVDEGSADGVSIGIRGPVTIQSAFSVEPVAITSTQITKSVSGSTTANGKRSSDTMGMKHRVDSAVYVAYGSMNPCLAERTGFTDEDAATIKALLPKLLENDASSGRPEGSMEVVKVVWWSHPSKSGICGSAKVHRSLKVNSDGSYNLSEIEGLTPEEIDGF